MSKSKPRNAIITQLYNARNDGSIKDIRIPFRGGDLQSEFLCWDLQADAQGALMSLDVDGVGKGEG